VRVVEALGFSVVVIALVAGLVLFLMGGLDYRKK
jgi:hypothetical protein